MAVSKIIIIPAASCISYELRNIYTIRRGRWYVVGKEWKIDNVEVKSYGVSKKKCIHRLIKRNSQNKGRILTKCYLSVYQRASLDFDISLDIFGADLAEIFKFNEERLL